MNTNPYQSPRAESDTPNAFRSGEYLSRTSNHAVLRFLVLSGISATILFAMFCLVDYITVRVLPYPERVDDLDWTALVLPIIPFVLAHLALKSGSRGRRLSLSIASTVLACLVAGVLILTLGISFHFAIGGSL